MPQILVAVERKSRGPIIKLAPRWRTRSFEHVEHTSGKTLRISLGRERQGNPSRETYNLETTKTRKLRSSPYGPRTRTKSPPETPTLEFLTQPVNRTVSRKKPYRKRSDKLADYADFRQASSRSHHTRNPFKESHLGEFCLALNQPPSGRNRRQSMLTLNTPCH